MMSRVKRAPLLLLLALFLIPGGDLEAQAYGRVSVLVTDTQGTPLQGVKVIVTTAGSAKFREEKETNKKGKALFSFTDATRVYDFRFEHDAYPPVNMPIKPQIQATISRDIIMTKSQAPAATQAVDTGARIYSPAERTYNDGVKALQGGDMATAKGLFLEALEKDGDMAFAHSALAGIYLEESEFQLALASAQSFLSFEPTNLRGLRMLYQSQSGLGLPEAEKTLKILKERSTGTDAADTAKNIYNEGVAAARVGDYKNAKTNFLDALEFDPELEPAIGALAIIYNNEENWEQALVMAAKHLSFKPDSANSLRINWTALVELGRAEEAAEALRSLAEVDPEPLIVEFYNRGNELFENGEVEAAKKQFERILEIDPEYARAHYRLGICHVSSATNDQAKTHLERFIALAPDDPEAPAAKEMLGFLN